MTRLAGFIGSAVGGTIGWWLGAYVGTMTAFMLSIVGTGAGIYVARRVVSAYD
jgi:F0F1-type ATP synthase assembly protein I